MFYCCRCDIKKISHILFEYYTSNIIINWLLAFGTTFDICTNMTLFNKQSRKFLVR